MRICALGVRGLSCHRVGKVVTDNLKQVLFTDAGTHFAGALLDNEAEQSGKAERPSFDVISISQPILKLSYIGYVCHHGEPVNEC